MIPDHYAVLGVSPTATSSEIKRAYLRLAKEHHPDVASSGRSDDQTFALISHAYDVLKNPASRRAYDGSKGDVASSSSARASGAGGAEAWRAQWRSNANWRRRPGGDGAGGTKSNSYAFDDDEDWDGNTSYTAAEVERRNASERTRAREKADAARWWKHERLSAERRRRQFREADAAKTARRSERTLHKVSSLWHARARVVWQDVAVLAVGAAVCLYAGFRYAGAGARNGGERERERGDDRS